MKGKIIFIIVLVAILQSQCTKEVYAPNYCFQEDILPIFVSNCTSASCHNSIDRADDWDLSNYEGIMEGIEPGHPNRSEVYLSISGKSPKMPPESHPDLTRDQVNSIWKWIRVGAPNSSNCYPCDTVDFSFSGRIFPILENWCIGCHNSQHTEAGIDLSTYSKVIVAVNDGSLLGTIRHESGYVPMPYNANMLNQCQITAIENWINGGAQDN